MKNKMKRFFKEIIFFIIIITILSNVMSIYKSQNLLHKPLTIQSFVLMNNKEYKVPKNRPILIHFWATWCPTCKLEAPNIEFLSKHFEVLSIAVKSGSDEEIKKYLTENGYTFNVVNDKDGALSAAFHISGFPTTFIYDKNKKLRFSEVGYTSTLGLYLRMLWAGK